MKQKSVIIDASAIMAVLLKEDEAMNVLQKTKGSVLLSAKCLPYEIANSLSRQLKRQLIALEQVRKIFSIFNRLPIDQMIQVLNEEREVCFCNLVQELLLEG